MAQGEWDPLKELASVQRHMNKLFETALGRTNFDTQEGVGSWSPAADVYETPETLVLHLELPGLKQEAIDLRVDGDELVVEGDRRMEHQPAEQFHRVERSYGKFSRRFRLPSTVNREQVEARYRNGVLTVVLPKQGSQEPKAIKVPIG